MVVSLLLDDLRSQIFRSATEGGGIVLLRQILSKAKISEVQIPILSHENVLRFDIPVNNMLFVQVANGQDDLSCIKLGPFFLEAPHLVEMSEELSASHKVHNKEDFRLRLENVRHLDKEGVLGL